MKKLLMLGALAAGLTLTSLSATADAGHRYRYFCPSYGGYGSIGYGYGGYGHYGGRYHHYSGRSYFPRSYGRSYGLSYHNYGHHGHRGFSIQTPGFRFGYYR